jgi:hypothetical protein
MRETAKQAGIDLDRPGLELVNARLSRAGSMPIPTISMRGCSAKATCTAIASG